MVQDEEDDLAAEEENKIINEVSSPDLAVEVTVLIRLSRAPGVQDLVSLLTRR